MVGTSWRANFLLCINRLAQRVQLPALQLAREPVQIERPSGANCGRPGWDGTPADASGCPAGHVPLRLETVRRVPLSRALLAIRRRCHKPRTPATSTACGRHCVPQASPSAGTTRVAHRGRCSELENGPAGASAPGRRGSFGPSGIPTCFRRLSCTQLRSIRRTAPPLTSTPTAPRAAYAIKHWRDRGNDTAR